MEKIVLDGLISVNCYILDTSKGTYIIDPGSDKNKLIEKTKNLDIKGVLLTHGHMDHVDQIGLFNCPIYISEIELPLLLDNTLNCYSFLNAKPSFDINKLNIITVKDGDMIDDILVISTPGHTRGSVSYLYKQKLFSGDTLFNKSIGRTDLPTGNNAQMKQSILKLMELSDLIKVYPGHDENTTIKSERQENSYYKLYKK